MKRHLLTLLLLIPVCSKAQSKELLQRIDRFHTLKRLSFEKKYDSVVAIAGKLPFRDSLYLYATEGFMTTALLHLGDTTTALKYLVKTIENQGYESRANIHYSLEHFGLDSNREYKEIVRNFDTHFSKHIQQLNLPMLQECLEIYYTDTRTRYLWMMAEPGSKMQAYADSLQDKSDLMNVEAMTNILRKYKRFPGISEIGISFCNNFKHILAHFAYLLPQDTLMLYLKEATLKGELPNHYGPFLIDKRARQYEKGMQTYGVYGNASDYIDGVFHYPPIKDIDYVDKRRADFLLPPLYKMQEVEKSVLPKDYDLTKQKR